MFLKYMNTNNSWVAEVLFFTLLLCDIFLIFSSLKYKVNRQFVKDLNVMHGSLYLPKDVNLLFMNTILKHRDSMIEIKIKFLAKKKELL